MPFTVGGNGKLRMQPGHPCGASSLANVFHQHSLQILCARSPCSFKQSAGTKVLLRGTDNRAVLFDLWFKINGTNIPNSNFQYSVFDEMQE